MSKTVTIKRDGSKFTCDGDRVGCVGKKTNFRMMDHLQEVHGNWGGASTVCTARLHGQATFTEVIPDELYYA